jgi:hypothetical protein
VKAFAIALQSSLSMAAVQALTALGGDFDCCMHVLPVQHMGMSFAMQSASVNVIPHRLMAWEQNSVTIVAH